MKTFEICLFALTTLATVIIAAVMVLILLEIPSNGSLGGDSDAAFAALTLNLALVQTTLVIGGFVVAIIGAFGYSEMKRAAVGAAEQVAVEAATKAAIEAAKQVADDQMNKWKREQEVRQSASEHRGNFDLTSAGLDGAEPARGE